LRPGLRWSPRQRPCRRYWGPAVDQAWMLA
jgi:hypothetical protein